jgi:hypothetical protein
MTEDFIHFIWRTRNFNFHNLRTTEGAPVQILDFGQWNTGAGPDFSMGRVSIDGTVWAGSIEMHLSASEWLRHGHTDDPAYGNVILHVVIEEDRPAFSGERRIPCIEIKDRIDSSLLGQYLRLMANASWVPCAAHLAGVEPIVRDSWLDRMLVERLQSKTDRVFDILTETKHNWEVALYRSLAIGYGFNVNAAPFDRLARLLPLNVILKHRDSLFQVEALVFGCAGLLNQILADTYAVRLQQEFAHLSTKYSLRVIEAHAWKWGKLRPANFPSMRLAQFAALMTSFPGLFRAITELGGDVALKNLLQNRPSEYWSTHYDFDKPCRARAAKMGVRSAEGLLINIVAPFLYCFGNSRGYTAISDRAVELLSTLSGEENQITKRWIGLGVPNRHAGHSQGLIHLKKAYCDQRRCVECAIGNQILTLNDV